MKQSVEAKHVLGEKKHRSRIVVAKRIGGALFDEVSLVGANQRQAGEVYDKREDQVKSAEAEALAKSKGLTALKPVREAIKEAEGRTVTLRAELPTATIEAGFKKVDFEDAPYLGNLQNWGIRVTTKGKKPLTSAFAFRERILYESYEYRSPRTEPYMEALHPGTGKGVHYYGEADKIKLANTVGRIFDELRLAGENGQLAVSVQSPQPESVSAAV